MINYKSTLMGKTITLTLMLGGIGGISSVHSADWIIAPGFSIEQVYSDNANLDSEGVSESITRITPRISAYREGARARLDLSYAPQYRHYWQETKSNDVVHFLRTDGEVELVKNHLFIDGWATADQHTINSGGRTGVDSLTGTGELTEVYTGGISPYFTSRLGPYAALEARYGLDRVYYTDSDQDGSTGQRVDLVMGSGPSVRVTPWELHLEESQVDYDDLEENDQVRRARAELIYQLNRQWGLSAAVGYEEYELAVNEDIDGQIWNVGFIYTPTIRTRLAAGLGERSFGDDYYLQFSHRARRTVWGANYERNFVSARDEVIRPSLFVRQDAFGELVRDPVLSSPVTASRTGPSLTEEHYLLDKFTASFTLATERTTFSLTAGYSERDYEEALLTPDTTDTNLSAYLSREVRSRITSFISLSWNDHEQLLNDYEQWTATLGGSYQLGPSTALNLNLSHLDRQAALELASYTENRASLSLQVSW